MGYPAEAEWPNIKDTPEYGRLRQDFKETKWDRVEFESIAASMAKDNEREKNTDLFKY